MTDRYKDVHTEHCCIRHGCKYDDDDCSVFVHGAKQSYDCESCDFEKQNDAMNSDLQIINKIKQYCSKTSSEQDGGYDTCEAIWEVLEKIENIIKDGGR